MFKVEPYINKRVKHKVFGLGKVETISERTVIVIFDSGETKKLGFPDAFQKFLKFQDPQIQKNLNVDLSDYIKVLEDQAKIESERLSSENILRESLETFKAQKTERSAIRTKITKEMAECSYDYARRVYQGKLSINDAAERVARESGMNQASAFEYIGDFGRMMDGEVYKRAMKNEDSKLFIENIFRDYGDEYGKKAIKATWAHIEYYEDVSGASVVTKRKILTELEKKYAQKGHL